MVLVDVIQIQVEDLGIVLRQVDSASFGFCPISIHGAAKVLRAGGEEGLVDKKGLASSCRANSDSQRGCRMEAVLNVSSESLTLHTSRMTNLIALLCDTRADLTGVAMAEGCEVVAEEVQKWSLGCNWCGGDSEKIVAKARTQSLWGK